MTEFHAYYSPTAAKQFGFNIYEMPDGSQVETTDVGPDRDGASYLWQDKIYVGVVSEWVRSIKPSKMEQIYIERKGWMTNTPPLTILRGAKSGVTTER
jgi:hypothetical protein